MTILQQLRNILVRKNQKKGIKQNYFIIKLDKQKIEKKFLFS